jgi:hypothetical protein
VFNQSTVAAEEAGWKDSLYKLYTTSSHSVRFAVYGFKHDAAPYEELLRDYCRLQPRVRAWGAPSHRGPRYAVPRRPRGRSRMRGPLWPQCPALPPLVLPWRRRAASPTA